jgi:hypothetical protein
MKQNSSAPLGSSMHGRAIYDYQIGSLEGQLLTLLEGLGMRESQEKAAKDMLKSILRTSLYIETKYVYGDFLNDAISKSDDAQRKGAGVQGGH